ncbi:MAG: hypothetical protein ACXVCV_01145, partial [Polyangia bacterium]
RVVAGGIGFGVAAGDERHGNESGKSKLLHGFISSPVLTGRLRALFTLQIRAFSLHSPPYEAADRYG